MVTTRRGKKTQQEEVEDTSDTTPQPSQEKSNKATTNKKQNTQKEKKKTGKATQLKNSKETDVSKLNPSKENSEAVKSKLGKFSDLTQQQLDALNEVYYEKKFFFGRDKLYNYLRDNQPYSNLKISRRQVAYYLSQQEINQLFKPTKETKNVRPTVLARPYKQIAIDLADMAQQSINGYRYILTAVDLFSKRGWAEPLKDKTKETVFKAFKKMSKDFKKVPRAIRSDNGAEFKNNLLSPYLKSEGIQQVFSSAETPTSNGGIERYNGVLKNLIKKMMLQDDDSNWVKLLPVAVDNINRTVSRITGKTPLQVEEQSPTENQSTKEQIKKKVVSKNNDTQKAQFQIGDKVRIKLKKGNFKRGGVNWSREVYEVSKINYPNFRSSSKAISYRIKDPEGDQFDDMIYDNDLQRVFNVANKIDSPYKYEVRKLEPLEKKDDKGKWKKYYRVFWKGYKQATIEPREELYKDIPKMIDDFEKENEVKWKYAKK